MRRFAILVVLVASLAVFACSQPAAPQPQPTTVSPPPTASAPAELTLATTTSTADSGLLDAILPDFEKIYNAKVKVIAVGTGQALETGRRGDADVLLVHARSQEDKFVADGDGINRRDVMFNDFILVGPGNDPAGVKGSTSIVDAFKKISTARTRIRRFSTPTA